MRWAGDIAHTREMRNVYRILFENHERRRVDGTMILK
jgi:hypothetical protein